MDSQTLTEHSPETAGALIPRPRGQLAALLRRFVAGRECACVVCCGLAVLSALTAGVSIMLLLPMLQLCGISSGGHESDVLAGRVRDVFDAAGLTASLGNILFIFVGFSAAQAVALYYQAVLGGRLKTGFCMELRVSLYQALNYASRETQTSLPTADVAHAISVEVDRLKRGVAGLLMMCSDGTLVVAYAVASVFVAPLMSALAIVGCGLFWPLLLYPNRLMKRSGSELTQKSRRFYRDVLDHMAGLKESRMLSAEGRHVAHFDRLADHVREAGLDFERARGATSLVFSLGAAISLCLMLYFGTVIVRTPAVDLVIMIVIFARLIPRLRTVQAEYQQVIHALPALDTLTSLQQRYESAAEPSQNSAMDWRIREQITLRQVCFRYSETPGPWVLDNINLEIPARKVTAVVGASGAGKSTLADILLGLLIPHRGEVLIDGRVLCPEDLSGWRRGVGYVPQQPFLLNATLRENLCWSKPDATDLEIETALEAAAVRHVVAQLPSGLDTRVGPGGINLSGGERQRITLARAILRQPSVLILDEATSSLDGVNQQSVLSSLRSLHGRVTVILIAHRLSTVREADQIVILENGRVAEQGRFEDLCANSDRFRALVTDQPLAAA